VVDATTEEDEAVREPGGPVERDFAGVATKLRLAMAHEFSGKR
jgi:hypothetical protein